jgi:4-carboxymuconolactone decarboxylase
MEIHPDNAEARLPLLDPIALDAVQRKLYDHMRPVTLPWAKQAGFEAETADGRLLGPFNSFLYSPELGSAHLDYLATERKVTDLNPRVREVVILTVGVAFEADYEIYAHRAVAVMSGLSRDEIQALAAGKELNEHTSLTTDEYIANQFVASLVRGRKVEPTLFAKARDTVGYKGLVDILHLAGIYMTVSVLLNAFDVPAPE